MARLTESLIFVFLLQFVLVICGVSEIPVSTLYDFLINPAQWNLSAFLDLLIDLPGLALAGGVGVVFGTIFRNDLLTFSSLTVVFLSFGQPIGQLFTLISAQLSTEFAVLLVSSLTLIYIMTIISFWRGTTD